MRLITLVLIALFLTGTVSGQIADEIKHIASDSLINILHNLENNERIDALNKLAFSLSRDKPDTAIEISLETKRLSEISNYPKGIADAQLSLGLTYLFLDSLKTGVIHLLNALPVYENIDTCLGMGLVLNQLQRINHATGRYEKSKFYGRKAAQVYNAVSKPDYRLSSLRTLIFTCTLNKEYDSSEYYSAQCLEIADKYQLYHQRPLIYLNKAFNLQWQNYLFDSIIHKRQDIINLFKMAESLSEINRDSIILALSMCDQILEYQQMGTKDGDKKWRETALRVIEYGENTKIWPQVLSEAYRRLGSYEYSIGNISKAISLTEKAIRRGKERMAEYTLKDFQDPFTRAHCRQWLKIDLSYGYDELHLYYKEVGNYKKALDCYALKEEIDKEIAQLENKDLIAILETDYENEKTRSEFAILESGKELSELRATQYRNYIYGLVILLGVILFFALFYIRLRRIRMQQRSLLREQELQYDLQLKQVESEKLKELDKMKSRFFANISHEFRTPLTLILGPLEKFRSISSDPESQTDLNIMQRNALRLQKLIDQLLSLSKLESGKMKLQLEEKNVIPLINAYLQSFESLAKQKQITLSFISKRNEILNCYIDQDKLEKILYNLLSNAFKFSGSGGIIVVEVSRTSYQQSAAEYVKVSVSDTGPGISRKKLPHIFDRFYQANDNDSNYHEGTGIGLALTKELVELHCGRIEVESEEGVGSTFSVYLPLGKEHFKEEEFNEKEVDSLQLTADVENITRLQDRILSEDEESNVNLYAEDEVDLSGKPLILIVEDNEDMRYYIRTNISGEFLLTEAEDGEQGFEKAIEKTPDMIISDVMMPKMDGMELCKKIKTDQRTSHIPVILLTAKASVEDRMEGLETGADDFLTKPFDVQELIVRVKNLIRQRKVLQEKFLQNAKKLGLAQVLDLPESGFNSVDQEFLNKAVQIVNANMEDEEFSVEKFREEMNMGRTQLQKKLNSLVGQPPSVFIRTIRLNRAAELIKTNKANISEIAYEVGFNNLSYFSKCFQEQFGVLPSQYSD